MALLKPFGLLGSYKVEPTRSDLTSPFDLVASYDEDAGSGIQNINGIGFDSSVLGSVKAIYPQFVRPTTYSASVFGQTSLVNKNKFVFLNGFLATGFGQAKIKNVIDQLFPSNINSSVYGRPTIYNLRQYIRYGGLHSAVFGTAYMQGGVKYIKPVGFNANIVPIPKAINTRANQYANPIAIVPPIITGPKVSPRMLRPVGIKSDGYGQPFIQRNPSPKGFVNTTYGVTWISHSPRYLTPSIISAFESGYPKVFDPTQKIFFNGTTTIIVGGVFGDIGIRNTRRIINTLGILSQQFSDWAIVESTRRSIESKSFNAQLFGNGFIRNKTPSIAPQGFISISGLTNIDIGYRIRTVKPSGFYQPKLGIHTLTKNPELNPKGINALVIGNAFISNRVRNVYAGIGRETLVFGETTTWHYSRKFNPLGIKADSYGVPRIEHGSRTLLAQGSNQAVYGYNAWLSFAKRLVQPVSIPYPNMPIHRVGGTQRINPFGYIATLFGTRIIPENQAVYPQGFSNPFGLTTIDLWKKYLKPTGFLTTGQEGGHRFGTHHFWNLRKYIVQFYDVDSGLVPPKWTGWTSIANRNKVIGAIGNDASRVASPSINNNARPIYPLGISSLAINKPMIADRVRHLKLQGLEDPYISGWHVVYNDAFVIAPRGINAQTFGVNQINNTRRYFNRIGNFESLEMGKPMIADRIRKLSIEQRYSIAPPHIPIHRVDLYTRYIEEVGRFDDHQAFGSSSFTIHFNIIAPRWTLRDGYGNADVKNLTPELGARGRNSEEFGDSLIRLQWRPLLQQGSETVLWGKTEIAYRDRQFSVSGFTHWNIPRPKVIKTGVPPYYPQYIWLNAVEIDGEENKGHGIEIPKNQVSQPIVKSNVIFPQGFIATSYGSHHTQSNGILVQPGLQELLVGQPFVGLKNRSITVPSMGDLLQLKDIKPRFSPWTIYAVMEAPSQAKENHEPRGLHFVNSDSGTRLPGEVFGNLRIDLKHRKLNVGMGNQSQFNSGHKIDLKKRYINLTDFGFRSQRTGFHVIGPFDQQIIQFDAVDSHGFGQAVLKIPYTGPYFIKPSGLSSMVMGRPLIDFFNRTVKTSGRDHLQMGARLNNDEPFMWQGLRVGPLVSGNYGGFESEAFGNTFISLKVRDLILKGFETFAMEYDYTNFNDRMRVTRKELPRQKNHINALGFDATGYSVPNIKPATQYIRPDGNSDQFRKGAW